MDADRFPISCFTNEVENNIIEVDELHDGKIEE